MASLLAPSPSSLDLGQGPRRCLSVWPRRCLLKFSSPQSTTSSRFPPTGIGTDRRNLAFNRCWPHPSPLSSVPDDNLCSSLEPELPRKQGRNLLRVASVIGLSTVVSKLLGLLRETLLAAVFGVGPIVTAFNYSSILPGFFMAILGGVNGPLHVTMVAILRYGHGWHGWHLSNIIGLIPSICKCNEKESRALVEKVSTVIGLVCGGLGFALLVFADPIISATAPGLLTKGSTNGLVIRELAVLQLKIMSPCALLGGLTGIGFGNLSAAGIHGLTSLSPSLSSICIVVAVILHLSRLGNKNNASQNLTSGAVSLALGATFGALSQWFWQVKTQHNAGLAFLPIRLVNPFKDKDLHRVLVMLLPTIVGSSMLQFATFTDLYFASFIPGAAAGLGYANLLVMAPLGILSSSILLPMLSLFAQLVEPSNWTELKDRIGQGLLLLQAVTLPMTAIMIPLSMPIVETVLQRFAFDAAASALVSSLVVYYVAGSTFYLSRDLLVQVFYALGDGHTPFCVSIAAIFVNALLDWILVRVAGMGANGLVLATSLVHVASAVVLLMLLSRRLGGLPLKHWLQSSLIMTRAAILAGVVTFFSYKWWLSTLKFFRDVWMVKIFSIIVTIGIGILSFYTVLCITAGTEIETFSQLFKHTLHQQTR